VVAAPHESSIGQVQSKTKSSDAVLREDIFVPNKPCTPFTQVVTFPVGSTLAG
jgi:hypothetical protein